MVTRQKMIVFASSIGFTTPWNIVERYSSKNRFKKVQIPKIPPWHKEGSKFRIDLYYFGQLFRGGCGGYVIHLFSMVSFFACTCPNQLEVGAIDNPDWFEQVFDQ